MFYVVVRNHTQTFTRPILNCLKAMKLLWLARLTLQAIALAIFAYQMVEALRRYMTFSSIASVETKDITAAPLPDIYVCHKAHNVSAVLKSHHYHFGMEDFLRGEIYHSSNGLSWEGVSKVPYETILGQMQPNTEDIMVEGKPHENWKLDLQQMNQAFVAFNGFCLKIVINTTNIPEDEMFIVSLYSLKNKTVEVIIADTGSTPYYMINSETVTGDTIAFEKGVSNYYSVNFQNIVWREENLECTNYGEDSEFKSYAECVSSQQPKIGCKIPWLSAPGDPEACKGKVPVEKQVVDEFIIYREKLWEKVKMSDMLSHTSTCLRPCVELKAKSTLKTREVAPAKDLSAIFFNFKKTVTVIRNTKAYGIFDLIVEIGSSLGLWLGLSALGVFDFALQAGEFLKTIMVKNMMAE